MWAIWMYYSAVVAVGIGFLTLGIIWTIGILTTSFIIIYGIRHRSWIAAHYPAVLKDAASFLFNRRAAQKAPSAARGHVEETDRRWMFPTPSLSESRGESFEALSESFLLLKRMVPYHSAALFEYDMDARLAYPRLYSTASEMFRKDGILSVTDGVVGYCLSSGKPVNYADFKGDARLLGYYSGQEDIRSVVVHPLDYGGRRLGALVLDATSADVFTARGEEIGHVVKMLSELMARIQREEAVLMRLEQDRTLKAMTERMAKTGVSVEQVADGLCRLARDVFPADRVTFVVFDDAEPEKTGKIPFSKDAGTNPSIVRFRSLKMIDRYVELVQRTRKTIRLDDIWENGMMSVATGQSGTSTRSMLASPFVFDSEVVGVIVLESDSRRAFNVFHETAAVELVQHASTAVARAIEYGRMEKTCAMSNAVPSAAEKIFSEPSLDAALEVVKSRFGAVVEVVEIRPDRSAPSGVRAWEREDREWAHPTPIQAKSAECAGDFVRVDGKVIKAEDMKNEIPAGSDIVFALCAAPSSRPMGLLCLQLRSPAASESLSILDRIRSLIQIRLVLERRERQFGFLKLRDPLTGIMHTAAFESRLEERFRRAVDESRPIHFLLVQPGRLFALKRTHGIAETVRRYASLCSEIERLVGASSSVGRVGPEDIGIIWEDGAETMKTLKAKIERLSDTFGFQIHVTVSERGAGIESIESLIDAAARTPAAVSV